MALLKISCSAPQCKLLGTDKKDSAQVRCVQVVQVKKAQSLFAVSPLPIECQVDEEEVRERKVGKQQKLLPGHLDGVQVCSIELLHGGVQPRPNMVLRQKDVKGCAQSASCQRTIAPPTGVSHNGDRQQEGDTETVTDRVVTAVHSTDTVDILQGLSCRNMGADWALADQ